MTIDFHSEENRYTYASREAHGGWAKAILDVVDPRGARIADVGCGGGIYSNAWADLGAAAVVGVDFSEQMVIAARESAQERPNVSFQKGSAENTGLPSENFDVVFERALIHHLQDFDECFAEAYRLLAAGGKLIIQDRTPEDVQIPGSAEHIRGYFFELFPRLTEFEIKRRPKNERVRDALLKAGFSNIETKNLWETRKVYGRFDLLAQDLYGRTGRSILHELDNSEIERLIEHIGNQIEKSQAIFEKDRWTLWVAKRV
ncbi:class I SAM-dependent methyltransferase [Pseudomonas aeruginosa]|uniref:class I SAM-dependent methyltransferase n=1 Tax=Pseudomonas aeruginosa TaxID=287 RepID=UPI002935A729|nr:class I SAM-dependent methyltransferase [Pseudomonas aeruginosa]MDV2657678.1 class I SAM-dependent methyltransferase [Pseudomonas aeruginosa]